MDNNEQKIAELENEISTLPSGSVVKKTVNGKVYYYHRYTENGKRKEKYLDFDLVDEYRLRIERRKALESELKVLKAKMPYVQSTKETKFNALIRTGSDLLNYVQPVKKYKKRECFSKLKDYVYGDSTDRVFILYGLRRTGKTTMIRQLIGEMSEEDLSKTAFIQIAKKDTLSTINQDLHTLERLGYAYIFIDEVTLMEDFIEGAALFPMFTPPAVLKLCFRVPIHLDLFCHATKNFMTGLLCCIRPLFHTASLKMFWVSKV